MSIKQLIKTEREFEAEARAEGLRRFQEHLQSLSDSTPTLGSDGAPLLKTRTIDMQLKTTMGVACIKVKCGICRKTKKYETPFRIQYVRGERGALSPELEQRVIAMSCETGSFEAASKLCEKWGCTISDDKIMDTVGRVAEICLHSQLPAKCDQAAGKRDILILMMDGWFARHREDKWGKKKAPMEERVAWREIKSAVIYKLSDVATVSHERRTLVTKHIVAMPARTDPVEFGKKVELEAVRMGMLQAKKVYLIMDGGLYLWGIYEDRFRKKVIPQLDYYHASQHLQSLAEALFEEQDALVKKRWLKRMRKNLKIWGPNTLIKELVKAQEIQTTDHEQFKIINEEAAYFQKHESHMNYPKARKEGVPIGSGSVESLCSQLQNRFKRRGQFWSHKGLQAFLTVYTRYVNDELEYCYAKTA